MTRWLLVDLDQIIRDMGLEGLVWIEEGSDGQLGIVPQDQRVLVLLTLDGRWDRIVRAVRLLSDTAHMYQGESADL